MHLEQVAHCKSCGVALVPDVNWSSGLYAKFHTLCRACNSAKGKEWYRNNKDRAKSSVAKRRRESPEKFNAYQRAYKARDPEKWAQYHVSWRDKVASDPVLRARRMIQWVKCRAKRLGVPFDLTVEFLADKISSGICEVTGIPFELGVSEINHAKAFSPSVDRITPGGGYTQDNVRVVVYIYNIARSDFSEDDVLTFAKALVAKS